MFIISNAQGNAHPMSSAFMGFCIDYVESSYCNLMEVVVPNPSPCPPSTELATAQNREKGVLVGQP